MEEECGECTVDQRQRKSAEGIEVIRGEGGVQGVYR